MTNSIAGLAGNLSLILLVYQFCFALTFYLLGQSTTAPTKSTAFQTDQIVSVFSCHLFLFPASNSQLRVGNHDAFYQPRKFSTKKGGRGSIATRKNHCTPLSASRIPARTTAVPRAASKATTATTTTPRHEIVLRLSREHYYGYSQRRLHGILVVAPNGVVVAHHY